MIDNENQFLTLTHITTVCYNKKHQLDKETMNKAKFSYPRFMVGKMLLIKHL